MKMDNRTGSKERILSRLASLKIERERWMPLWRDVNRYVLPMPGRYLMGDNSQSIIGASNDLLDTTATMALRTLSSGLMGGLTSPARPWFRLVLVDKKKGSGMSDGQAWLDHVQEKMVDIFQQSNTYQALHTVYEELSCYGTAANILLYDKQDIIRHYPMTVGEYSLGDDYKGNVNTIYREFEKTVYELTSEFGIKNVSDHVKSLYEIGAYDNKIKVIHVIQPRTVRDPSKVDNLNMPWESIYLEQGGEANKFLSVSGFKRFPVMCPRWGMTSGDVYGTCPAIDCLGTIRRLMHAQARKKLCLDLGSLPPLQAPTSMKNKGVTMLPGSVTYTDSLDGGLAIKSLFDVKLDLKSVIEDIAKSQNEVKSAFYSDMFLMLANSDNRNMTATEVAERKEEKMLMIGPVLERLQNELLDPLIAITYNYMVEYGVVDQPPESMTSGDVNVEHMSILAQSQKAIALQGMDRFMAEVKSAAEINPSVIDRINIDNWIDSVADRLGISIDLLHTEEDANAMRQQRAQQENEVRAQEVQAQQAQQVANLAKAAPLDLYKESPLNSVINSYSGY